MATGSGIGTPVSISITDQQPGGQWPQLPLEQWRRIISYNPWHFWGLANSSQVPVSSQCNTIVTEHAWQNSDAVGREEIRSAIITAEARLREYLNYSIGRRFITETIKYPRPLTYGHQYGASVDGNGRWLSIRTNEGYLRSIGVETYSTISESSAVVLSDEDGDGINETFTISASTSLTDASEIGIYFVAADRLDSTTPTQNPSSSEASGGTTGTPAVLPSDGLSERWRISPVNITITSNGALTIKGNAWQLVRPILYEGYNTSALLNGIDPSDSSNFVSEVGIYRRYSDPTGTTQDTCQALLVWETEPYPYWAIGCSESDSLSFSTNSRDPAAVAYGISRAQIRDARLGIVTVGRANYDSDTGEWAGVNWGTCRQPDRVIIRYEAGAKISSVENTLSQSRLFGRWDEIVARFAAAELTHRICACDTANRELYRWQHDWALDQGGNLGQRAQENPFGTRGGAIYAWERVRHLMVTQAYVLR